MQSPDKPTKVEIVDTTPLWKRIIGRPFHYYFRMGSITFGLTFFGNLLTTFFDENRSEFMRNHSQFYIAAIFIKSCYFGIVWPSFYLTALNSPQSVFVVLPWI